MDKPYVKPCPQKSRNFNPPCLTNFWVFWNEQVYDLFYCKLYYHKKIHVYKTYTLLDIKFSFCISYHVRFLQKTQLAIQKLTQPIKCHIEFCFIQSGKRSFFAEISHDSWFKNCFVITRKVCVLCPFYGSLDHYYLFMRILSQVSEISGTEILWFWWAWLA